MPQLDNDTDDCQYGRRPATLPECLEMDKEWYRRSLQREGDAEERDLGDEGIALRTAMVKFG